MVEACQVRPVAVGTPSTLSFSAIFARLSPAARLASITVSAERTERWP